MDPRTSTSDRVKACAAAVPYERSKVSVQIRVGPSVLSERLAHARALKTVNPKTIEHTSLTFIRVQDRVTGQGGNGVDIAVRV